MRGRSVRRESICLVRFSKGCFPVLRFLTDLRIRTECAEHVDSFIDAYWAHSIENVNVRKKNASLSKNQPLQIERRRSDWSVRKKRGQIFSRIKTEETRLIYDFYYMAFGLFSSLFSALCNSSLDVAVYITSGPVA